MSTLKLVSTARGALALLSLLLLGTLPALAREKKDYDSDVNYEESKTTLYDLTPLLVTA